MRNKINKYLLCYTMPFGLLVLVFLLQIIFYDVPLFSALNIKNMLLQSVSIAMTALGLSYIMMSGEGDLSFAGMFSLLTVVFAIVTNAWSNFFIAIIAITIIAVGVNLMISLLVTRLKFSSFIVSIAVMFMANGIEKAFHQQTTLINSEVIKSFSTIEFGLPLVVWLMAFVYLISYFIINKTRFGFNLRIVGENKYAAIEAGINSNKIKVFAYIIAGLLLALAASVESTRVGAIYEQGKYYMLPVFAACFFGSSMFVPGRVNVVGTLVGALFLGIIDNFMKMINVESYIVPIVQGTVLIVSVALASVQNRSKIVQIKL
ncbi:MAG: ABC transporter permease [Actinobacteria bacterium]|nr:ABC transporter permease [Actinomycetota bacterium]